MTYDAYFARVMRIVGIEVCRRRTFLSCPFIAVFTIKDRQRLLAGFFKRHGICAN